MRIYRVVATAIITATMAACAPVPVPAPTPKPIPAPPVIVIPPRPMSPGNAAETQLLPPRGVDGRFRTINSNVTGNRAFWQMRIGLNVAAIGCRGAGEAQLVAAYNQLVKVHGKLITSTEKAVIVELGKETGTDGTVARDRMSTQLFNYFAQPPAQPGFCAKATELVQLVAATPTAQLVANAPTQLIALDQPFLDFYEAFASFKIAANEWDSRYAPRPSVAPLAAPATGPAAGPSGTGGR